MPTLILAADPGTVQGSNGRITADMDDLRILDGQHRIQAFGNAVHALTIAAGQSEPGEAPERLERLRKQELPVVIIEVRDKRDQRQLFAWFARNKPIEPAVREFFDESNPFGKAAKVAMEDSKTLNGNVTYSVRTVPPRGRELISLSNLKEIATTIQLGIRSPRAEDIAAAWEEENQLNLQNRLIEFFDEFLPACTPNYGFLANPNQIRDKILSERSNSHAGNPLIIRLVANAWARWTVDHKREPERLARHIGTIKMNRADPTNDLEEKLEVITGDRKKPLGLRDRKWEKATADIIREAQG